MYLNRIQIILFVFIWVIKKNKLDKMVIKIY